MANKYISKTPDDSSKARIPLLKYKTNTNRESMVTTNNHKAKILAKAFFPPPPDQASVPTDYHYPEPVDHHAQSPKNKYAARLPSSSLIKLRALTALQQLYTKNVLTFSSHT